MILSLYGFLIAISLVLIIIGFLRPTESALALIGFFFMFLLSLVILAGNLEYETGSDINNTYTYDSSDRVNFTAQTIQYQYEKYDDGNSHYFGYWLAAGSVLGFAGVLWSLRKQKHFGD